jgi:hypothetical protein
MYGKLNIIHKLARKVSNFLKTKKLYSLNLCFLAIRAPFSETTYRQAVTKILRGKIPGVEP